MEDSEQVVGWLRLARKMLPGIFSVLGTQQRGEQDRRNLEADRAFVEGMLQAGQTDFRFRGIEAEYEAFGDAHQEETERLVSNTVNAMLKAESVVDWSKVHLDQLNPEFRRRWISEASNVSDETLQDLWARLLAGELESPGSVSNDTMSIARDLNKERAGEFQTLCSAALYSFGGTPMIVVGCGSPGANSLRPYGLSYEILMRLAHHRLINNEMNSHTDVAEILSQPGFQVRQGESTWLLRWSGDTKPNDAPRRISGILFTPAGEELFAVVQKTPNPAYTVAMLEVLEKDGWAMIPLSNAKAD